ncbi:SusC/RagA family TonB-linked outer membrane protein [Reichenbachiella agariperforans]|uniref:SusC/RagA family TonB-linked outer membrane protein n=1 Tax=Reichenbachiella agariperforans TaxID=156994 RepID=UPI001C099F9B|nr:SusC/RagA family TonB-linked outer membrane protein [Reichenbachiella agariperforans]MBU2913622.1 SusC/RagA family TonB-linked outer membrane protein [Reichenbachiella agariperforans]
MLRVFTLLTLFFAVVVSGAYAQQTVSGKVFGELNDPLPGVSVVIAGTTQGTITDLNGEYKISIDGDSPSLIFSFIGYENQSVEVGGRSVVDVTMVTDVKSLDEVVVTAFGVEQEKKALGYAVQQLDSKELMESQQSNVVNALQGRVAGVQINSSSGQPGSGSSIIIRGITSLNPSANNQPLIVVDGIVMSNATDVPDILPSSGSNAANSAEQGSSTNRLADINPNDIESLNILKGPAAAALYGVRAANGAIIITTKSGKAGKTIVNFSATQGWDVLGNRPELQEKYREGRYGRLRFNSDGSPLRFQTQGPKVREGTEIYDNIENFFETGRRQEYNISAQGGTEKARFFTSIGRLDQSGITPESDWARTSFRLKGDITASDKLTIRSTISYTNSGGNKALSGDKSIMSSMSYMTNSFDVTDYINPDGSMKDYSDGIIDNPLYLAKYAKYTDDVNRISGNVGFNYKITPWLSADYTLGVDQYNDNRNRFMPPGLDGTSQTGGFIVDANIGRREINSNFLLTATADLTEDLNASLTLGQQVVDINSRSTTRRGEGFLFSDFNDIDNTSNLFGSDNKSQYRQVGFFFDAKANYKGIVYLGVTGRNDISSSLSEENNSYFYPGVNLGLIFSEFLSSNHILSYGKVRASWAQVGKDAAPHLIGFTYSGASGFPFDGINGFRKSSVAGDENLKPETTTSFEIGTDLRFINNRLSLDATYYVQNSTDMITNVPLSNSTGLSRYTTNAGEIENKGIELMLNAQVIKTSAFSWDMNLNWSKNEATVISVADGIDEIEVYNEGKSEIIYKLVPGGNVGDLYGNTMARTEDGQVIIGSDGFPQRATDPETGALAISKIGNAIPDFIAGWNNRISYKGISLSALLEWRKGGDVMDMALINGQRNGIWKDTERRFEDVIFAGVKNVGTAESPVYEDNDIVARLDDGGNTYRASWLAYVGENTLQDASWLRLRTVTLGYQLPSTLINKVGLTSARITFTGNNLFVNTPYKGYDPESNYFGSGSNIVGFTGMTVPGTKSYLVTLNLKF